MIGGKSQQVALLPDLERHVLRWHNGLLLELTKTNIIPTRTKIITTKTKKQQGDKNNNSQIQ